MLGLTPRGNSAAEAQRLALELVSLVPPDAQNELAVQPDLVISDQFGVAVTDHTPSSSSTCSVDGLYTPQPPTISVARGTTDPRRRFSLLHELAHHLQRQNFDVMDALNLTSVKQRRPFMEDICDAFAAEVLLPADRVDELLDGAQPTAQVLLDLFRASGASRAACCVRLAQRLDTEGYMVLATPDGAVSFAARAHDAFPVARGTQQPEDSGLVQAGRARFRGKDRLRYRSGWHSGTFYAEAVSDGEWVYAAYQVKTPEWGFLPLTEKELRPLPPELECGHCGADFRTWKKPCERCGEHACTECSRCGCGGRAVPLRQCENCFCLLMPNRFEGDSTICDQCS